MLFSSMRRTTYVKDKVRLGFNFFYLRRFVFEVQSVASSVILGVYTYISAYTLIYQPTIIEYTLYIHLISNIGITI